MHFGATLGSLLVYEGAFVPTLEPLWGHFVYIVVALGHFTITLGSLWCHFGCLKIDFQKTLIFHKEFNDFIKLWS